MRKTTFWYLMLFMIGMIFGNIIYYFQYQDGQAHAYCQGRYGDKGVLVWSNLGYIQCYEIFSSPTEYQILKWDWILREWKEIPERLNQSDIKRLNVEISNAV